MAKKEVKKPEEEKALVAAPASAVVAMSQEESDAWGTGPALGARDTIIPNLLLMQPMSQKVVNGEAVFGELRDSLTNFAYGSFQKPVEIIPFHMTKVWVEHEIIQNGNKTERKYLRTIPIIPANEELPLQEGNIVRTRTMQFFALVASEIAEGGLPKRVSFRVTSIKAGKKLATQMYIMNRAAGLPPPGKVMSLSVTKTQNAQGIFGVLDVEPVRNSTAEERAAALRWFKLVQTGTNVKVDDAEERGADAPAPDLGGTTGQF